MGFVIAIDGPAASGKGTLGRALAEHFGLHYLDTGRLYRAVAFLMKVSGQDVYNATIASNIAAKLDLSLVNDEDLRGPEIGEAASIISQFQGVRDALLEFQIAYTKREPGVVMDGRDIGTVIAPNAEVKLYITALPEVRASRRLKDFEARGEKMDLETLTNHIISRDKRDKTRALSPLRFAEDTLLIDSSTLDIRAVLDLALHHIACRLKDHEGFKRLSGSLKHVDTTKC